MKVEWNIVIPECGEQCVMISGISTIPLSCADNSDCKQGVSSALMHARV